MQETVSHQQETMMPAPTELTAIIEQNATDHPDRWHDKQEPLFGRAEGIALSYEKVGVASDDPEDRTSPVRPISSRSWMVNMYGGRWMPTEDGPVLQTTDVQNLPTIHEAIATTVLAGENARTAYLVDKSSQVFGTFTEQDLAVWLETVQEGHIPIMGSGRNNPDGSKGYITHDYTDFHTSSGLLWGKEIQDRITTAAGYELRRRATGGAAPDHRKGGDGVGAIDQITCEEHQVGLVDFALHGPGENPKDRMLTAWETFKKSDLDNDEAWQAYRDADYLNPGHAAIDLSIVKQRVDDLENFIQWSKSNGERYATDEEKEVALREAVIGLTRVAEKLEGTHDGSALELPDKHAATSEIPESEPEYGAEDFDDPWSTKDPYDQQETQPTLTYSQKAPSIGQRLGSFIRGNVKIK